MFKSEKPFALDKLRYRWVSVPVLLSLVLIRDSQSCQISWHRQIGTHKKPKMPYSKFDPKALLMFVKCSDTKAIGAI